MSKNEMTEKKAVDAEVKPVNGKAEQTKEKKTVKILGFEIKKAEKAPKQEKVKLTKEEKKVKRQETWAKIKDKAVIPAVIGGLILGAAAKSYYDSLTDHPTDDEYEDNTVYELESGKPEIAEHADAEPAKSEKDAKEKTPEET